MTKRGLLLNLAVCLVLTGCVGINWSFLEPRRGQDDESNRLEGTVPDITASLAYRDTVAQSARLQGMRKMRVRGYGLVVGLGDRGSAQCPPQLRRTLIQEMHKQPEFQRVGAGHVTPEQLIDSADTAVVMVQGDIPAAAAEGARFDLYVQALPGSQTMSLEGGRLRPCQLRIYRDVSVDASVPGKPLAIAEGPIFRNPFSNREDAATRANVQQGVIIGGGTTLEARRVRLIMSRPSYRQTMAIARRINSRFTGTKVAEAESPSYIKLRVPQEYRDDPGHFLALVRHLYVPDRTGFAEQRARALAKEILEDNALYENIALAWEGIGRPALPTIGKLYGHASKAVSFYAARTGVRLDDHLAVQALARHACDPAGQMRLPAIETLGRARGSLGFLRPLRGMLDDPDPRIRVAAYEALHERNDKIITSWRIGDDNFILDKVPFGHENLIYAKRSGDRRIAILGDGVRCERPIFYNDPGGQFTLNAEEDDATLTVFRRTPQDGIVSPPIPVDCEVDALLAMLGNRPERHENGDVGGLGVDYSAVVEALHELCRLQAINAKFMLEQETTIELFGPLARPGRPESEL